MGIKTRSTPKYNPAFALASIKSCEILSTSNGIFCAPNVQIRPSATLQKHTPTHKSLTLLSAKFEYFYPPPPSTGHPLTKIVAPLPPTALPSVSTTVPPNSAGTGQRRPGETLLDRNSGNAAPAAAAPPGATDWRVAPTTPLAPAAVPEAPDSPSTNANSEAAADRSTSASLRRISVRAGTCVVGMQ